MVRFKFIMCRITERYIDTLKQCDTIKIARCICLAHKIWVSNIASRDLSSFTCSLSGKILPSSSKNLDLPDPALKSFLDTTQFSLMHLLFGFNSSIVSFIIWYSYMHFIFWMLYTVRHILKNIEWFFNNTLASAPILNIQNNFCRKKNAI